VIYYWENLIADAELLIDVATAGAPRMAEVIFAGVRVDPAACLHQEVPR